jgi:hypothetical protein
MSLSTQAVGYLDITNAILRVGTLDVAGIQGVDAVTNVLKGNSVLLWDDQGSDMASPPFQLGAGVARSTSPPEIDLRNASGSNFMYAGLKLPNAWLCKFDLHIADTSTGNVHVQMYTESTTSYGDDGYQLIFDGANNTVTLEYDGAEVLQESVTLTTGDWETVVVAFNRGAWTVTYGDDVVLNLDDSERADVYDNPVTGQYFRVETDASTARKIRYFKITNNGPFLQSNTNDISYVSGNVAIGQHSTTYKLSVAGTANVGALDVQSNLEVGTANLFVDTLTGRVGVGTDLPAHALDVTGNVQVGTANLFVDTLTGRVGVGTTEPEYDLDVHGSANVGALSVTSVTSNLEVGTANLFVDTLTGKVGVGSTVPEKELVVTGTVRVQDALSSVADVSVVQDDLTVSSNVAISGGGLELTQVSNVAQITSSSNVVTEFNRSKRVEKFPRVAMTGPSAPSPYVASSSSNYNSDTVAWRAFANNRDIQFLTSAQYNYASGLYTGSTSTTVSGTSISGEWLQIKLAEKMELVRSFYVSEAYNGASGYERAPQLGTIAGSNDGSSWTLVHRFEQSGTRQSGDYVQIGSDVKPNAGFYQYYRLICEKTSGGTKNVTSSANYFSIGDWQLFGYPEDGSDVNGTDLIMRSDPKVPVDENLRLYWDFSDYTSLPSTVTDKSGNGFTGTVNGSCTFDNEYKAITFAGASTTNVSTSFTVPTSDFVHTVAFWLRVNDLGQLNMLFSYGNAASSQQLAGYTSYNSSSGTYAIESIFYNNDVTAHRNLQAHRWYHVCYTYSGKFSQHNTRKIFIDGNLVEVNTPLGGAVLNLPTSGTLYLGRATWNTINTSKCSIANFRIYDRVLAAHEVMQLYDYQKEFFQKKSTNLHFTGGRLGIGTHEPMDTLHVLGNIRAGDCDVVLNRVPYYWARQENISGYWTNNYIRYNTAVRTNYPDDFKCFPEKRGIVVPKNGVYRCTVQHIAIGSGSIYFHLRDWKTLVTMNNADQIHYNYGSSWESFGGTALITVTNKDSQAIEVYSYVASGNGVWAAGDYHGSISIQWVADA